MKTYFGINQKAKSYRLQFVLLFLSFGCFIAFFISFLNYQLDNQNIHQVFKEAALKEVKGKERGIEDYKELLENYVVSLRESAALSDYLENPSTESYGAVTTFFYSIARSNPQLMQVRFIDNKGHESVRVDYPQDALFPIIVSPSELQNKKHRYYYQEAAKIAEKTFWYSNVDLNVEHNEIEIPYKPVLRAASPVYFKQEFRGIVIVNVYAQKMLDNLIDSSFFDISIIDKEGEFIVHHDETHSWSRYLQKEYTVFDELPEFATSMLKNHRGDTLYSFGSSYLVFLGTFLPLDMPSLLISPKKNALEDMQSENRKATIFVILVILGISIPLALLLSQIPVRLHRKIAEQTKTLSEYVALVDENILTSTIDEEYYITSVSSAFSAICGYSKAELSGQKHELLRSKNIGVEHYLSARRHLERGHVWQGDLLLKSKAGADIWMDTIVYPRMGKNGERNYWAIYEDITSKKELEIKAITDDLTGLFNRRHFNVILKQELERARRNKTLLCFAILDVDHFKQYNDNYGHQKGDRVLEAIGRVLSTKLNRASDSTFRLGGEEFGVLFSGLEKQKAIDFAESVRCSITELNMEHKWSDVAPVITASMGLLCLVPQATTTTDQIYRLADESLYKAKNKGRNTRSVTCLDNELA